ncbi:competence protein CoiA family protein [Mesorhizobium sp.]|uniref:competence protein CoiA n=1 Tax=Mesorhizobium sp. TaxID=1871066 RepID=UPI0025FD663C|nr:competence protein CoiA family protein [Mesorhizobium sp.]
MPLRCLLPGDQSIHAFDLRAQEWAELRSENRRTHHLRMPCCAARVVMKVSPRGQQFFAHQPRGICITAPETEEHLFLKGLAVEAARKAGWTASTEVRGSSPTGEEWTADVLATKGNHRVAVEIQWSRQTAQETMRRQQRYRQSGVRSLWLIRKLGFPISKDLPAVFVGGDKQRGFEARIPNGTRQNKRDLDDPKNWRQRVPMASFLQAAFERRFRYGIETEMPAIVTVQSRKLWCRECRAATWVVTSIEITVGPYSSQRTLLDLPDQVVMEVVQKLPLDEPVGTIKSRFIRPLGRPRLSNGCYNCDALIDDFFESQAWCSEPKTLAIFPVQLSNGWQDVIGSRDGWGVHPTGP